MHSATTQGSEIRFRRRERHDIVPALAHARILASSASAGWPGMFLEVGTNLGCEVDELMVDGHYVGMQLNEAPITIRTRTSGHWSALVMPSRALWIHPEGTPFSVRHSIRTKWVGAVIDGKVLDGLMGRHHELRAGYAVIDTLLSHLLLGMAHLLTEPGTAGHSGGGLPDALVRSFILALGQRHGRPAAPLTGKGGIAPHQLRTLLAWTESRIGGGHALSVEAMAARVGLSAAHFAREFKRSTGATPWAHVMELRLTAAYRLLAQGKAAGTVAAECGFSDQSHLCRAMKGRFGLTPGEVPRRAAPKPPSGKQGLGALP